MKMVESGSELETGSFRVFFEGLHRIEAQLFQGFE